MNLHFEFSYRASLKPPLAVGDGPYGTRLFFEVIEGSFEGKRLNGKILTGGGDWLLAGADYYGLLEMNAKLQAVVGDVKFGTEYGDHYFRTNPRFETGDPRYAWLNQTLFVA